MRGLSRTAAGAVALALSLSLMSCSDEMSATGLAAASTLRVGVKSDQPGLGMRTSGGAIEGFDVDVATYIGGRLGVAERDIEFVPVTSADREAALEDDTVDMVVATFSITPDRKSEIAFGGPYYVAHQDILVEKGDDSVRDVSDLKGDTLCQGRGSYSGDRVVEERNVDAEVTERDTYSDCVSALADGKVDAVSTDDLMLAGFMKRNPGEFELVNAPFTDEKYGVGVPGNDVAGCEAVNRAIIEMYQDGTAGQLLDRWFGDTGLDIVTSVPQFEGCD